MNFEEKVVEIRVRMVVVDVMLVFNTLPLWFFVLIVRKFLNQKQASRPRLLQKFIRLTFCMGNIP